MRLAVEVAKVRNRVLKELYAAREICAGEAAESRNSVLGVTGELLRFGVRLPDRAKLFVERIELLHARDQQLNERSRIPVWDAEGRRSGRVRQRDCTQEQRGDQGFARSAVHGALISRRAVRRAASGLQVPPEWRGDPVADSSRRRG